MQMISFSPSIKSFLHFLHTSFGFSFFRYISRFPKNLGYCEIFGVHEKAKTESLNDPTKPIEPGRTGKLKQTNKP